MVAFHIFANAPKNSPFCPHIVFIGFVWISEQTAIISLYSIDWLVFITETESVYCAVLAESSHIIQQCSPRRKTGFDPRPFWDLWWAKWHWEMFFSDCYSYPLSVSYHQWSILVSIFVLFWLEGQWAKPGRLQKAVLFRKFGCTG